MQTLITHTTTLNDAMSTIRNHKSLIDEASYGVIEKMMKKQQEQTNIDEPLLNGWVDQLMQNRPHNYRNYVSILVDAMDNSGFLTSSYYELKDTYEQLFGRINLNDLYACHKSIINNTSTPGLLAPTEKQFKAVLSLHLQDCSLEPKAEIRSRMKRFFEELNEDNEVLANLSQVADWMTKRNVRTHRLSAGIIQKVYGVEKKAGERLADLYNLLPRTPLEIKGSQS